MTALDQTKFIMFKYMITTHDTYQADVRKKSATKTILDFTLFTF